MASISGNDLAAADSDPVHIDACALIRPSQISPVIDRPVSEGRREDAGIGPDGAYSSSCIWIIDPEKYTHADPTAPLGGRHFVILNAMQWQAGSGLAHSYLDAFREAAIKGEIPAEPSPRKFGNEALWWGDGLAVRQGDVSFGISVFLPTVRPERPGIFEEQLAVIILRRLDERT